VPLDDRSRRVLSIAGGVAASIAALALTLLSVQVFLIWFLRDGGYLVTNKVASGICVFVFALCVPLGAGFYVAAKARRQRSATGARAKRTADHSLLILG
jgi:hypothetical protein